ncbi:MAG TPA: hypothetical protein VMB71_10640, partial [Acetobacteraceae bacterium]|nr:hypothetical protein [Acetobacteraceae bacterium]
WDQSRDLIPGVSDIGGWLNQAAWAPQHLAAASCVLLSALLLIRLAERPDLRAGACLAATIAAGFESSIWVGGVQFALAGTAMGIWFLAKLRGAARLRFLAWSLGAALAATLLILPLAMAELHLVRERHMAGIALAPYHAIGAILPLPLRLWLDPLAFPILLLFLFPALLPFGLAGVGALRRSPLHPLLICAAAAIATTAALRSTIDNNDLGWRAFLPALFLLAACAGPAFATLWRTSKPIAAALSLVALFGLPDAIHMANEYIEGYKPGAPASLAASRLLWQAVREHTGPSDRVANNPDYLAATTPWPANISWALFADRPSCYASRATAIAFAPLTSPALAATNALFLRVFGGASQPGDITALARNYDCAVAILTPADAAWSNDPFAHGPQYHLVDSAPGWRIYRRTRVE